MRVAQLSLLWRVAPVPIVRTELKIWVPHLRIFGHGFRDDGHVSFTYDSLNRLISSQNTAVTSASSQLAGMYRAIAFETQVDRIGYILSRTIPVPVGRHEVSPGRKPWVGRQSIDGAP